MRLVPAIVFLVLAGCGPKEKGRVIVSAFLFNDSGKKLLVINRSGGATDTLYPGHAFTIANRVRYRSPSKPLCCPCAAEAGNFQVVPAEAGYKLTKNIDSQEGWEKQTHIKIDNWNCRLTIDSGDVRPK